MDPNELLQQLNDFGAFSTANIIVWVITGAFGTAYLVYGFKQKAGIPLLAGVGLSIFPFFISNLWLQIIIGSALIAMPFVMRE